MRQRARHGGVPMSCARQETMEDTLPSPVPLPARAKVRVRATRCLAFRGLAGATVLMAGAWLCGCSLLSPQPDVSRFYTLSSTIDAGAASATTPRGLTYGLGPITLPPYLDRSELATRVSAAEVTYSQTDFWAEPLKSNLTRVLQQNLAVLLGSDRIVLYPWPRGRAMSYQVAVSVLQFERTAAGEAQLHVRWSIREPRSGAEVSTKESTFVHAAAAPTATAAVTALSADLGDLSREIASALQSLPGGPFPFGSPIVVAPHKPERPARE
jgi:uncharacterized lipoprotein YmbA